MASRLVARFEMPNYILDGNGRGIDQEADSEGQSARSHGRDRLAREATRRELKAEWPAERKW